MVRTLEYVCLLTTIVDRKPYGIQSAQLRVAVWLCNLFELLAVAIQTDVLAIVRLQGLPRSLVVVLAWGPA